MSAGADDRREEALGILYAGGAYVLWGFVPLYWALLGGTSPFEITAHRILWGALFALGVTLARGRMGPFRAVFASRETLGALAASSVLIAVNWTIYIWSVSTHQLVEASLGYYLTPLVSMALGLLLLGEEISRLRMAAIGLAALAVAVQAIELGHVSWIAPALAVSFGFYGFLRKKTAVDALDGLAVETMMMLPVTLALILYWGWSGTGTFGTGHAWRDLLLVGAGPITAVPLTMFAAGARRVRMTTLGFLQYLAPSLTLIVATVFLGEPFTHTDAITFGFVWSALALAAIDGQVARLRARRAA
jgi:chloramphenicol-sensitive protein RarD